MKEVTVTSPKGQFAAVRLPDEKVEGYVARHSELGTWGRPEHWTTEPIKDAETRENEFGETEYLAPAEFIVTVTDITERLQAEEQKLAQAKAQRQQEINKLKSGQLTLEQKVEVLWRLYLSDQGELELEAPPPGGGKEGKL